MRHYDDKFQFQEERANSHIALSVKQLCIIVCIHRSNVYICKCILKKRRESVLVCAHDATSESSVVTRVYSPACTCT